MALNFLHLFVVLGGEEKHTCGTGLAGDSNKVDLARAPTAPQLGQPG